MNRKVYNVKNGWKDKIMPVTVDPRNLDDPDSKWQVIFKIADGRDYCRETLDPIDYPTTDDVVKWAEGQIEGHEHVTDAVVERW